MTLSLAGNWSLRLNGSDIVPPMVPPEALPFCSLISGRSGDDDLQIRQSLSNVGEEVIFEYSSSSGPPKQRRYNTASPNMEAHAMGVTLSVVLFINKAFTEFSVLRLGPRQGHRCIERYRIDGETRTEMKVDAYIASQQGKIIRLVKYFNRNENIAVPRVLEMSEFSAWQCNRYRSLEILETTSIGIIQSISLNDTVAKRKAMESKSELAQILGKFGAESSSTVIFIIMVVSSGTKWLVGHRYSSFELLKRYLELELHTTAQPNPLRDCPPFPGKVFGFLTNASLEDRRVKLETYLTYFIDSKAMGSENAADALLSFLEIPEHIASDEMRKQEERLKEEERKKTEEIAAAAARPKQKRASIFGGSATTMSSSPPASTDHKTTADSAGIPNSTSNISGTSESSNNNKPAAAPRQRRASTIGAIGAMLTGQRDIQAEFGVQDDKSAGIVSTMQFQLEPSNSATSSTNKKASRNDDNQLMQLMGSVVIDTDKANSAITTASVSTANQSQSAAASDNSSPMPMPMPSAVENHRGRSKTVSIITPHANETSYLDTPTATGTLKPSSTPSTEVTTTPTKRATISFAAGTSGGSRSFREEAAVADDDNSSVSTTQQQMETASQASASRRPTMSSFLFKNPLTNSASSRNRSTSMSSVQESPSAAAAAAAAVPGRYNPAEINAYPFPQDSLHAVLRLGIVVLKHGRTGKPKKRLLRCDNSVSRLFWEKPPTEKSFLGSGRRKSGGEELTPDLPGEDKSVLLADVLSVHRGDEEESGGSKLIGTANLRRSVKREELKLCFYLVLPSRTFDIQCLCQDDFDCLFPNFVKLIFRLRSERK